MEEQWKYITECPKYRISNLGRVMAPRGNIIKSKVAGPGYEYVRISGRLSGIGVHRLVALTWIPNPDNHKEINHKDGNKWNNCIDNLEWCSRQHNITHSLVTGLRKPKLDETQIKTIKALIRSGELLQKDICNYFKIHRSLLHSIKIGRVYSNVNI